LGFSVIFLILAGILNCVLLILSRIFLSFFMVLDDIL